MPLFPFLKNSKLSEEKTPLTSTHETAAIWHRIHNFPEFQKADEEKRRGFLLFVLEILKQDAAIHMAAEFIEHDFISDSRLFPIPAVCYPVGPDKEIPFKGHTVVARPYSTKKMIRAVSDIRKMGFRKGLNLYEGDYYPDLDLILIKNGIHHSAVASVLDKNGEGAAKCKVYQLSDAYANLSVSEDFSQWVFQKGTPIPVIEPRFALMYMIAKELQLQDGQME